MEKEPLNPIVARIDRRLADLGISRTEASLKAGLSRDGIRNLARSTERTPRGETLLRLAEVLRASPNWLLTGEGDPPSTKTAATADKVQSTVLQADVRAPAPSEMNRDLPVMGTAAGSIIKQNFEGFELGGAVDYVRRPPALEGAKDVYAIYVTGDSMEPAHPAGELRFVHPHRPVQPGCTVIVQTRTWNDDPGQAYIKRLIRRSGTKVILEQFNPHATIEIPAEYVTALHRVLTMAELFGV
ncbi:phage repressor protein C with HTH and peptisase S24 domain [Breoghania corrubedonensis]|uniref:Phage repressor protein C with HTH and peptisase S24 domain n=1 Tax=Breoghania corrubedonensis TaxID=665038 RepID=A0A2T5UQU8_9HYPH|nr:phage repressor protein C with HTH and peptisase S24 domain [Breoghania corrubedonensis]